VFVVVPPRGRDLLHDKVVSNLQEVRARGAKTIVLAEEDDDEVNRYADVMIRLPKVSTLLQPLVAIVPLQIFACELATKKGHDVTSPTSPVRHGRVIEDDLPRPVPELVASALGTSTNAVQSLAKGRRPSLSEGSSPHRSGS
jgi:hypothetical protein